LFFFILFAFDGLLASQVLRFDLHEVAVKSRERINRERMTVIVLFELITAWLKEKCL
jgi:hypothetical protein